MNYSDIDNIVKLGKWAFKQIPDGSQCNDCPLLGKPGLYAESPYCKLREVYALCHDSKDELVFKDSQCPKPNLTEEM